MNNKVHHFIPCNCPEGGLILNGIAFEIDDPMDVPLVYVYWVHSPGIFYATNFWQRVKNAFSFLFGHTVYMTDVVLDGPGVIQLRDACQDALDKWPKEFVEIESIETNE